MTGSTQKTTSETKVPDWVSRAGESTFSKAQQSIDQHPVTAYTGEMTAPTSANQNRASTQAAVTANVGQADLAAARSYTGQAAAGRGAQVQQRPAVAAVASPRATQRIGDTGTGQSVGTQAWTTPGVAGSYMSPYTSAVQANTLREMDRGAAMHRNDVGDQAQGAHAFGGDRHAIVEAEQARNDAQSRSDYIDSSNAAAYANAQSQFNTDAGRTLTADTANQGANQQDLARAFQASAANQGADAADLSREVGVATNNQSSAQQDANRAQAADVANQNSSQNDLSRVLAAGGQAAGIASNASGVNAQSISNLNTTGAVDQSTRQAADAAAQAESERVQGLPLQQYAQLGGILAGTPTTINTTGTQKSTPSALSTGLGIAQVGASFFSDRRIKRNVVELGRRDDGLGVYAFRYHGDDTPQIGVMADEVERIIPEALGPERDGLQTVNYETIEGLSA